MDSYATDALGILYILDGLTPPRIWDGLTAATEEAGLAAPATAAVAAIVDSPGDILGSYSAYVRFVDKRGKFSDLSPISNTLTAQSATTKTVSGATNASPIEITTSTNHGLSTGNKVTITGVGGNTAANDTWTITVTGATTFTLDDSTGNAAYTSGGTVTIGISQIDYSSVPVATGIGASKVVARQILRNTDGQATTYYLDATINDNVTTTASSTFNDTELATQTAVPLLLDDGSPNANTHGVPPNNKTCAVHHLGRMFYVVDAEEKRGAVIATNGSTTVTGINTYFTTAMIGRMLYVLGATQSYEIDDVDEAAQTLTLTDAYDDNTDHYATFSIKPVPAERRLVYYSQAGDAEAVPATNAFSIQDDGTELTGIMAKGSFVYFLTERKIYRYTFRADPATDGFTFLSSDRGCINQRCFVALEDKTYMLDQAGIHVFDGAETHPVSETIQDLFSPEKQDEHFGFKINWGAAENFHACWYPSEETVRWFICMSGQYLPRHAITLNYRSGAIWIEEFNTPISASTTGTVSGHRRMYFGSEGARILLHGTEQLDGIDHNAGTLQGTVTDASQFRLTDSTADFETASLPGLVVHIVSGTGRGQKRIIHAASSTVLQVRDPWLILPDTTSEYQIAGIDWRYRSKWFRYADSQDLEPRKIAVQFQPLDSASKVGVEVFEDYSQDATEWGFDQEEDAAEGMGCADGDTHLTFDMGNWPNGYAQQRLDGRREPNLDAPRTMSFEMTGVSGEERPQIYTVEIDGCEVG